MMQWLIATLIHLLVQFMENSFTKSTNSSAADSDNDGDFFSTSSDNPNSSRSQDRRKLTQAYEFMELTEPTTSEELKKQYKKLSLRYHPDRNGNSDESKEQFQKLRTCVDLIEQELAGNSSDNDEENRDDDRDEDGSSSDEDDPFLKEIRRRQRIQRRYEEMRKAAEKAMEEEIQNQRERKKEFRQHFEKEKLNCKKQSKRMGLNSDVGRKESYQKFQQDATIHLQRQQQQQQQKERKQQQQQQQSSSSRYNREEVHSSEEEINNIPKIPKYDLMECNEDKLVIAIRLDMPDVASQIMTDRLQLHGQDLARQLFLNGIRPVTPQLVKLKYVTMPLDPDDNHLLLYAIYYKSYQIVSTICQTALNDGTIEELLEKPNRHGNTALWFVQFVQDSSISALIQSQQEIFKRHKSQTQAIPAVLVGIDRIKELVKTNKLGILSTLNTLLEYILVRHIFQWYMTTTIFLLFYVKLVYKTIDCDDNDDIEDDEEVHESKGRIPGIYEIVALLMFCFLWNIGRWLIRMVFFFIMWELILILSPFIIVGILFSSKQRSPWDPPPPDFLERLFTPMRIHARMCDMAVRSILAMNKYHQIIVPNYIMKKGCDWIQFHVLLLVSMILYGLQKAR